jgi:protein phosphatase
MLLLEGKWARTLMPPADSFADVSWILRQEEKQVLKSCSMTDIGRKRKYNQDFVFASEQPIGKLPNLFMVADGMGGHNAGDYASKYTVETVVETIRSSRLDHPETILKEAAQTANTKLRMKASENPSMNGMGTTLVAASCIDNQLVAINVGDSRLYKIHQDIWQITRDHSLVEEMVRMGGIDKDSARNHPDKNIITRAIGVSDYVEIDYFSVPITGNERFLLCSDGLTNMLEDDEIFQIVQAASKEQLPQAVNHLIEAANQVGGRDNIAVILIWP